MMRFAICCLLAAVLAACAGPSRDAGGASAVEAFSSQTDPAKSDRVRLVFAPGSAELSDDALDGLTGLAAVMQRRPDLNIVMAAFAGTAADNDRLMRRLALIRLLEVRARLMTAGISASRIHVRACGFRGGASAPDRIDAYFVADPTLAEEARPCGPLPPSRSTPPVTIAI